MTREQTVCKATDACRGGGARSKIRSCPPERPGPAATALAMPKPATSPLSLLAGAAAAAALATAVDAFLIEPAQVEVTHHDLPLPDLPPGWRGTRIVHLTD